MSQIPPEPSAYWLNGELLGSAQDEHFSRLMASAFGRGGRVELGRIGDRPLLLGPAVAHLSTILANFGLVAPPPFLDPLLPWILDTLPSSPHSLDSIEVGAAVVSAAVEDASPLYTHHDVVTWVAVGPSSAPEPSLEVGRAPWTRSANTPLAGFSMMSRLEQHRILQWAFQQGWTDALWMDEQQLPVEFVKGSLVWKAHDRLFTVAAELRPTWNPVVEAMTEAGELEFAAVTIDELLRSEACLRIASNGNVTAIRGLDGLELRTNSGIRDNVLSRIQSRVGS